MAGVFSMRVIRDLYDEEVLSYIKLYTKMNEKYARLVARKMFLVKCRRELVIPSHLALRLNVLTQSIDVQNPFNNKVFRTIQMFKVKILNLEISITFYKLGQYPTEMRRIFIFISQNLTTFLSREFFNLQKLKYNSTIKKQMVVLNDKLARLITTQRRLVHVSTVDNAFKNLTSITISDEVKQLLCLGPKFVIKESKNEKQMFNLISDFESIVQSDILPTEREEIRARGVNVIHNFLNRKVKKDFDQIILNERLGETRHFLKENLDVIIVRSDKGNVTVAMNKSDYRSKMNGMLEDTSTYEPIRSDLTNRLQADNNDIIKHLYNMGQMEQYDAMRCTVHNAVAPKIYGLPKVHKIGHPLRPVVSCINSPTYFTARYISDILYNIVDKDKYYIENSYSFQRYVVEQTVPVGYILVSLDVSSLFTNIPHTLILDIINVKWKDIEHHTKIVKTSFIKMLKMCLNSNYFCYEDQFYQQTFGMPMGSPLSPVCADLVMENLLDSVIPRLPYEIGFLMKYVDDIIAVVPRDQIVETVRIFNEFNIKLQFTIEEEVNQQIPFLDLLIIRDGAKLTTKWYSKPCASNRMLDYKSNHLNNLKINTAYGFVNRVFSLSDSKFHKELTSVVYERLLNCNYPKACIKKLILKYKTKNTIMTVSNRDQPDKFRSMNFVNGCSEQLTKLIFQYNPRIGLGFKNGNNLYSLVFSKLKQKVPIELCSKLIYKIPCKDCEFCYIGHTASYLKVRLSKHKSDVKLKKTEVCATAFHAVENRHELDFEETSIVDFSSCLRKRLVLEMLYINTYGSMNKKTDTDGLSRSYSAVVKKITGE